MYRFVLLMLMMVSLPMASSITWEDKYAAFVADLKPGFMIQVTEGNGQRCHCKVPNWMSSSLSLSPSYWSLTTTTTTMMPTTTTTMMPTTTTTMPTTTTTMMPTTTTTMPTTTTTMMPTTTTTMPTTTTTTTTSTTTMTSTTTTTTSTTTYTTTTTAAASCDETITATEGFRHTWTSNGYPNPGYSNNVQCVLTIQIPANSGWLMVTSLLEGYIDDSNTCADSLRYLSPTKDETICGDLENKSWSEMFMDNAAKEISFTFTSDSATTERGFSLKIRADSLGM